MSDLHHTIIAFVTATKNKGVSKETQKEGLRVICDSLVDAIYEE